MARAARGPDGLTERQRRFVAVFKGNALEAARIAGYRDAQKQAHHVLRDPQVRKALAERLEREQAKTPDPYRLTRIEWEEHISALARDPLLPTPDRLRAFELFAKAQAWLTDKVKAEGMVTINVVNPFAAPATEEKPQPPEPAP